MIIDELFLDKLYNPCSDWCPGRYPIFKMT